MRWICYAVSSPFSMSALHRGRGELQSARVERRHGKRTVDCITNPSQRMCLFPAEAERWHRSLWCAWEDPSRVEPRNPSHLPIE